MRIELQRNPLVAGERNWVKTSVRNLGTDDVTWLHGGCANPIFVKGTSKVAWGQGTQQVGQALEFKNLSLGVYSPDEALGPAHLDFVPKRMLGKGSFGCADIGIYDTVKPGEVVGHTLWWTGIADVRHGLPPTGPVTIDALGEFFWRGREARRTLDARTAFALDAWIVDGLAEDRLSPPEIADAALADPTFAAYVETQALRNGREAILWYAPAADVWEVGVMPWHETKPPRIHGVLVDPVTGGILGELDRPWDEDSDGFP